MRTGSPVTYLALLALALSLAGNAYLLLRDDPSPPAAETTAASGPGRDPSAEPDSRAGRCPEPTDRRQTAQMLGLLFAQARRGQEVDAIGEDGEAAGPRRLADEATRREVLCRVGEVAARADWNAKRDDLVDSVRESLADDERQEREMQGDARRMAEALELDDDQLEELTERYRESRAARMGDLRAALDGDEIDFKAAFDALAGMYRDEDRIVGQLFGDAARERLHDYEIDKRATILAIAATYANLDWNQSIEW